MSLTLLIHVGLLLSAVVSIRATVTDCKNDDQITDKCTCKKDSDHHHYVSLTCRGLEDGELFKVFGTLYEGGDGNYELVLMESDLSALERLPEQWQGIHFLKLVHVTGLTEKKLGELIEDLDDLRHLTVEASFEIGTLTKKLTERNKILEEVYFHDVKINKIEKDAFKHLENLKSLSLNNINLKRVPEFINHVKSNLILDLTGNEITHIPDKDVEVLKAHDLKISLDSVDCTCESKDSAMVAWIRESKQATITCSKPKDFERSKVLDLSDEDLCKDNGAITILSSSVLLFILLFIALL